MDDVNSGISSEPFPPPSFSSRVCTPTSRFRYCLPLCLRLTLNRNAWAKYDICCYRLYSKGRVLGHKRAKRNSRPNTSLIQIEGVGNKEDAQFYLGKVCAFRAELSTMIKTYVS